MVGIGVVLLFIAAVMITVSVSALIIYRLIERCYDRNREQSGSSQIIPAAISVGVIA